MSNVTSDGFGPSTGWAWGSSSTADRSNGLRYPSPWWDLAHMDLPTTVKSLFSKCRYHAVLNPLVASTVRKLSAYPITEIVIDDEPAEGFAKNKERWEDLLFRVVKMQQRQIDIGLNYNTYGNCLMSIWYPFFKYLKCSKCSYEQRIKRLQFRREWDFRDFAYYLTCPKCKETSEAEVEDRWYRSYRDIKLIRWNLENIDIDFDPITQTSEYAYTIPTKVRNAILQKKQKTLEELPAPFIQAVKRKRPIVLTPENLYHFKAPTPSLTDNDEGWGYPPLFPALKDSFYLQMMKKGQEAILAEQVIPLDILFPSGTEQANPYTTINLSNWKSRIENEIKLWRQDPNRKPVLPLPVGYQRIGGTGKALMLTQEIRAWSEHIIAGMDVPQEFVFGGLSYTGSSVSLRMLENKFMSYRDMHEQFLNYFFVPNVARFLGWPGVRLHMRTFRMADDIQAKQLLLSLNQLHIVSDKTTLAEFNLEANKERDSIKAELREKNEIAKLDALMKAEIQGQVAAIQAKYQVKANNAMMKAQPGMAGPQDPNAPQPGMDPSGGDPMEGLGGGDPMGGEGGGGAPAAGAQPGEVNIISLADAWARKLSSMDPTQKSATLQRMATETPQIHQVVMSALAKMGAEDIQPLPEQKPPRRGPGQAVI